MKAFITQQKLAETIEVAVYFPEKVEGGAAAYARIAILDENYESTFSTEAKIIEYQGPNDKLVGYAYSQVNVRADLFDKIRLTVNYHLPKKVNEVITMCVPTRFYEFGYLPKRNLGG
ncbi:hypothetical protein [Pseudoalteromonas luteoviolacea]|uniref:hypothetical protein n=1 Tax=Pseudoalteromonas luteoviolacea TaxID=43657 RepID=UPI0012DAC344|nr:hypothetical protein [Pseudoalteromonas luteoviolacea]